MERMFSMLNKLWGIMILVGILVAACNGRIGVFIGMVRRTVLLRELYDKYTTLPTDKRFKGSHPPM